MREYLTSHGVSDGRIADLAFGETRTRVPTADGVREAQNRRVEITYDFGFADLPEAPTYPDTAGNPPSSVTP